MVDTSPNTSFGYAYYVYYSWSAPANYFAPVNLPESAIINAVNFYTTDSSVFSRIEWTLEERILSSGILNNVVASNAGSDAAAPGLENLSVSSLLHSVDNSQYFYQMNLLFSDGDGALTVYFHSARITYMVGKPD